MSLPWPSSCSALRALGCTYPPERTGIRGSPASPAEVTSTPCRSAHQWVARASPVRLAKVALAVSAPPQPGGRPTSCRSQSSVTVSAASASRDEARTNAFWSSRDTTQSAASAAGVDPPITKWKKRGPAEAVAVAVPTRSSVSTAAWVPDPCSGSDPPSSPSIGSAVRS